MNRLRYFAINLFDTILPLFFCCTVNVFFVGMLIGNGKQLKFDNRGAISVLLKNFINDLDYEVIKLILIIRSQFNISITFWLVKFQRSKNNGIKLAIINS